MRKLSLTLLLSVALAGCACPPCGGKSGGRTSGSDPSGGTFSFLGGLKCFFGGDEPQSKEDTQAEVAEKKTTTTPTQENTDHAASLTIR
jgi:hypothetical protein